jgi:hypothetical protein
VLILVKVLTSIEQSHIGQIIAQNDIAKNRLF